MSNNYLFLDADFDSYWEEEARNPNRNRIRIGRQYQATVPPLLKPGQLVMFFNCYLRTS